MPPGDFFQFSKMKPKINIIDLRLLERSLYAPILQMSKLQETTSYFDENAGRVGVKSDIVRPSLHTWHFFIIVKNNNGLQNEEVILIFTWPFIFQRYLRTIQLLCLYRFEN